MFHQPKNPEFSEIKSQLFQFEFNNYFQKSKNQIQFFLIPKFRFFRNQDPNIFIISSEFEEHKFEFWIGNVVVRFCWTQFQWSTNSMNTCYEFEKHKFVEGLMFDFDFGVVWFVSNFGFDLFMEEKPNYGFRVGVDRHKKRVNEFNQFLGFNQLNDDDAKIEGWWSRWSRVRPFACVCQLWDGGGSIGMVIEDEDEGRRVWRKTLRIGFFKKILAILSFRALAWNLRGIFVSLSFIFVTQQLTYLISCEKSAN